MTGLGRCLALAALLGLVTGCGGAAGNDGSAQNLVQQYAPAERPGVERIVGDLLDGRRFDSAEPPSPVVVYNVWGSWCAPCRTEAPVLRRVAREQAGNGVEFIGINVRDNDTAARAFERQYRVQYPSISSDTSGPALLAFRGALPPSAVPSTLVVVDGRLASRVLGEVTYATLDGLVGDALATVAPGASGS
jgi:thiol-disulfide isomerase/thioredoxin